MASSAKNHLSAVAPLAPGILGNLRYDLVAGFLVFLIAMPLCLAIARASGFPPIAGIWTAVIGGVVCSLLSNSQLTIKGPAAGLIVIVYGAVADLGAELAPGLLDAERAYLGYKLALGIGVTAGILQVLLGLLRAGRLADFFPLTPVHGMLASIGIIIMAKQFYEVIGVASTSEAGPLTLIAELPLKFRELNPEIAVIGLLGLLILFGVPLLISRHPWLKRIPAQLVVLVVAIGLGTVFDLEHQHTYLFPNSFFASDHPFEYEVGPRFLVDMPEVLKAPASAFAFPDFRGLATATGLQYLLLFTLVGSLESLLSAKAIEILDPWHRKTNFDRDLMAIGLANTLSSMIGGLPMISEIVRSKANLDNGARTRAANLIHGLCLLGFVLLFPNLIHRIPLAALGAMLVYTGFRLANPHEFVRCFKVGSEQFVVFVGTILATLTTDLLIGMAVGIALKLGFHLWNGAPLSGLWRANVEVLQDTERGAVVIVRKAAVFTNWLGIRRAILEAAHGHEVVNVDLTHTQLVDHSVMEKLHDLEIEFKESGKRLRVDGLEAHVPLSAHPYAARRNIHREKAVFPSGRN